MKTAILALVAYAVAMAYGVTVPLQHALNTLTPYLGH